MHVQGYIVDRHVTYNYDSYSRRERVADAQRNYALKRHFKKKEVDIALSNTGEKHPMVVRLASQ